ncbi:MAG: hypothetical protein HYY59_06495 [Candidatus Omnitrophica bacterium]|nr:hypothetical protein [Candidatus Omnitrophota bacterium]
MWSSIDPYPGVHFVTLDQTDASTYDGDATFRQTRSRFEYDAFGNVTKTREFGDVAVSGDERQTFNDYAHNESAWLLGKPAHTKTTNAIDDTGRTVAERWFYYDGRLPTNRGQPNIDTTAPTRGHLTAELEWWDTDDPQDPNPLTQLTYDAYGNVLTVTDALGRTTTNTYDATGTYLVQIRNTLGHTRELTYDPRFGTVTRSTDQNAVATTTLSDPLGRVTKVIGPTDTVALPTIEYEYDLATIPTKIVTHTRVQSGFPLRLTHYTFNDGLGRTIQSRSPAEDPAKQVVTGAVELNPRGLVSKQWVPFLDDLSTNHRPVTLVTGHSSLATVSYTYDPLGRLLTTRDPDGSTTSTAYDDWSVTATDANGHQTRRTQDAFGRLATVEEFSAKGLGGSAMQGGGNDGQTYTTTYAYDALGNLSQVTDARGNVTRITYDSLQRKLSMDDPDMGRWSYAYDAVDNLTSQTDARGVTINFAYDALNRLTQKSYTVPQTSDIRPQTSVTYSYDDTAKPFSKGKLTRITDGSGSSSFTYDQLGRLNSEEKVIDGTRYTVNRSYDLLGRLTSLTYPDGDVASYTYNPQGGIETIALDSLATGHSPLVTDVSYNAAGQLTKIVYGNGTISDYTYNPQTLRLSSLRTMNNELRTLQDFSYAFDPVGNITAITDRVHTGTQAFQYDPLNRLTQAAGSYGTQTYAYDPLGNMTSKEGVMMTYGLVDGSKPHAVTSTSADSVQRIAYSLSYDANGNLIKKSPTASSLEPTAQLLSYDAENRLVEVKTAPEETVTVRFEPGWNFFSLPVIPADSHISALFPTFAQDFEQVARVNEHRTTNTEPPFEHFVNHPQFNDFDTLEYGLALTSPDVKAGGYQVYCKATSPVTVTITGKLPTSQASTTLLPGWHLLPAISTQQTAVSTIFGTIDSEQILRYDTATSSLTTLTSVEPGQAYFVQVRTTSTWSPPLPRDPTTTFVYDGDGGRVKQVTAAGTTTYLGEVFEKDPSGKVTKYVFAGAQRIAALAQNPQPGAPSALSFYHGDHLGSSNVITDQTGAIIEHTEHTPYGAVAVASSLEPRASSRFGFTGQREDAGTGLVLFPARAYDPALGRFIQPDPFVQAPADPQTLNRYSYVRNNPVNLVDPSGHFFQFLIGLVVAIAISVTVELAISAFNIEGAGAKALRFAGAIVSAGVGGSIGGLTGPALSNAIASAGATSLTLNTGEGRQLLRSASKRFQEMGLSPRAASIVGSAVTSTALSVGYGVTLSALTAPPGVKSSKITSQEWLTSEKYADLRDGEGTSGLGFWNRGRNVTHTARSPHAQLTEFSHNGRVMGVLARAPLFEGVPVLGRLARALGVTHSAFVGYESTAGTVINSMIPLARVEYGTTIVCHTCTLSAASRSGVPVGNVLTAIGPSSAVSSMLYGLYGGVPLIESARVATAEDSD